MSCVSNIDTLTGRVVVIAPDIGLREFSFNSVYNVKVSLFIQYIYDLEIAMKIL